MVNGHDPPLRLSAANRAIIKDGTCVTSGTYEGCIKVDDNDYRWVSPDEDDWALNSGVPGEDQKKITAIVWDKCKDGGTLSWSIRGEYWYALSTTYRWGHANGEVSLLRL